MMSVENCSILLDGITPPFFDIKLFFFEFIVKRNKILFCMSDEKNPTELIEVLNNLDDHTETIEQILKKPFGCELFQKTLDPETLSPDDLVLAIATAGYLNLPTKKLIEEFMWKIGEKEELLKKYFMYGHYMGQNRAFKNELRINGYLEPIPNAKLCVRYEAVSLVDCAAVGNLRLLKFMFPRQENTNKVCSTAARYGHLDCLMYAHSQGCEWNDSTCTWAAMYGHLDCLRYAHENGCGWNATTCSWAATAGQLVCLRYANMHGCAWDEWTCTHAAQGGHLECLKYAHEHGCKWDGSVIEGAAVNGHLDCLQYAHEHGCPLYEIMNVCTISSTKQLECLQYIQNLYEHVRIRVNKRMGYLSFLEYSAFDVIQNACFSELRK